LPWELIVWLYQRMLENFKFIVINSRQFIMIFFSMSWKDGYDTFFISEDISDAVLFQINFAAYALVLRVIYINKITIRNKLNYARLPQGIPPQRASVPQRFIIWKSSHPNIIFTSNGLTFYIIFIYNEIRIFKGFIVFSS